MKKSARIPTSEPARRISAIFHRQPTTKWHLKREIPQFRELVSDGCFKSLDALGMVERYYKANWPPRHGKNILRTDLAQLLNNWQGEVDRARGWCEAHPMKQSPRVIIPLPPTPSEPWIAPTDPESVAALARFEQFRQERKAIRK